MFRAVLFDFNGTLYNDTDFHRAAWQKYLSDRFGIHLTIDDINRYCIGPGNADIFHTVVDPDMSETDIRRCSDEKEAMYRNMALASEETRKLVSGAPELMDELTKRGVPFAVATASLLPNVEFYLGDLGLGRWVSFDRIVYEDGLRPSKPDPAFYLEAAKRLKVDPKDCIIVEDSATGFQAARDAGAGRIIAIDTSMPRDKILKIDGIYDVIHDYYNFLHYLDD